MTSENVNRRHLNSQEREFFYIKCVEELGVRNREDSLKQNSTNVTNITTVPSQGEHADALGVSRMTVNRWEKDQKEIMADPELSEKATTLEGYKDAKKESKSLFWISRSITPIRDSFPHKIGGSIAPYMFFHLRGTYAFNIL